MKNLSFLFNKDGERFSGCPTLVSQEDPKVYISHHPDDGVRFQVGVIEDGIATDFTDTDKLHQVKEWLNRRDLAINFNDYPVRLFIQTIQGE